MRSSCVCLCAWIGCKNRITIMSCLKYSQYLLFSADPWFACLAATFDLQGSQSTREQQTLPNVTAHHQTKTRANSRQVQGSPKEFWPPHPPPLQLVVATRNRRLERKWSLLALLKCRPRTEVDLTFLHPRQNRWERSLNCRHQIKNCYESTG